jgi:hypothetical protein
MGEPVGFVGTKFGFEFIIDKVVRYRSFFGGQNKKVAYLELERFF